MEEGVVHSVDRGLGAGGSHIVEIRHELRVDIDEGHWADCRTSRAV